MIVGRIAVSLEHCQLISITRILRVGLLATLSFACLPSPAQSADLPPPYQPRESVTGTLRIWGHGSLGGVTEFVEGLTRAWEEGFKKFHPGIKFENRLHGTASAIGALYTGTGDLALMGREIWPPEIAAFKEVRGYAPTGVDVLTGSVDVRNRGYAIAIFVHKDNPLKGLTLAQLDALFGVDRMRGGAVVNSWGDLGVGGEWKTKPVNLYGLPIARGFADYFEERVFLGARKWNPALKEFADLPGSKGGATDGGQLMLNAMAKDRYAIGYAGLVYKHDAVKPVALAEKTGDDFVEITRETVLNHRYPLTRMISMYFDHVPNQPVEPKTREFLRYVLSREGQDAVLREGHGYLPMLAPFAAAELRKLEK